jgi:hypothetical protein
MLADQMISRLEYVHSRVRTLSLLSSALHPPSCATLCLCYFSPCSHSPELYSPRCQARQLPHWFRQAPDYRARH